MSRLHTSPELLRGSQGKLLIAYFDENINSKNLLTPSSRFDVGNYALRLEFGVSRTKSDNQRVDRIFLR